MKAGATDSTRTRPLGQWLGALAAVLIALMAAAPAVALAFEVESLNGSENNLAHPTWGEAGTTYQRLAPANYADGVGTMVEGPNPRYVSNRVFNSLGVDLFSERNVSQWVWVWGQFLDHNFGRAETGTEEAPIPFDSSDPLERFSDTLGYIPFERDAVAPGTGTGAGNPRQQVNAEGSYIDGAAVYGNTQQRLEWLRTGPDSGNPAKAGAKLLLPHKYLPLTGARHNIYAAPSMDEEGALAEAPQDAVVAGDTRANENAELTAVTTLLAREHNRIVAKLPSSLSNEEKFQLARRVVAAEEQYITYNEFLPAVGVTLKPYEGYDQNVDAELSDEFSVVGYRPHSMVNGEEQFVVPASYYKAAAIAKLEALGIEVARVPDSKPAKLEVTISQNAAFFDPAVVPDVGLGPLLAGLTAAPGYKNDEQIDDSLRSVLFGIPGPGAEPAACFAEPATPGCFSVVEDLGAIDLERSRDTGMPSYNRMREAVGLPARTSFAQVTGESSEEFPTDDPLVSTTDPIEDPHILEFTSLRNYYGETIAPGSAERAVYGTRRTTLAARLKAIYGSVGKLDAYVGMISEPHVAGSELGELQLALWRKQFEALRDGDRFFYLNDPELETIEHDYGISYKHTLGELISLNTTKYGTLPADVFYAPTPQHAP
jgi:hypothetical protein